MTITEAARGWVGEPYRHQGRGPKGAGIDCAGLLVASGIEAGVLGPEHDSNGYEWQTDGSQLRACLGTFASVLWERGGFSAWEDLAEEGDVAVFSVAGLPQHVAIISLIDYGNETAFGMIHASAQEGKVVENRIGPKWASRLLSVWRLK